MIKKEIGMGSKSLIQSFYNNPISDEMINKVISIGERYYTENMFKTKLFSGVLELLNELELKGIKMAILSNKKHCFIQKILQYFAIEKYFLIYLGDGMIELKPSSDGIKKIIKECNICIDNILMVGDDDVDIKSGNNANVYTCFIKDKLGVLKDAKPNFIINDIVEILELIKN